MNAFLKRVVYIAAVMWLVFHAFGVLMIIRAGDPDPLIAAFVIDACAISAAGLMFVAIKLFPEDDEDD